MIDCWSLICVFTNVWPAGVTNRAKESDIPAHVSDSSFCDSNVSELVKEVKPRYVWFCRFVLLLLLGGIDKFGTYLLFVFVCVCDSYHIAGSMGVFYAREPYLNVDSSHVTRFLGLAQVGNKNKQVCSLIVTPVTRAWQFITFVSRFWFRHLPPEFY